VKKGLVIKIRDLEKLALWLSIDILSVLIDEKMSARTSIFLTPNFGHIGLFESVLGPTNDEFCPRTTV